jgi:hypothetical protein
MCNLSYCLLCKLTSHVNMTCEAYKKVQKAQLSTSDIGKMGIKKCGKCGTGIIKNDGCNHISCICGAHICWKCSKVFKVEKDCYDHLAK